MRCNENGHTDTQIEQGGQVDTRKTNTDKGRGRRVTTVETDERWRNFARASSRRSEQEQTVEVKVKVVTSWHTTITTLERSARA